MVASRRAVTRPHPTATELRSLLGEGLRHLANALVADPYHRQGRGVGIADAALRLKTPRTCFQDLPQKLADDRGQSKGSLDRCSPLPFDRALERGPDGTQARSYPRRVTGGPTPWRSDVTPKG
jgi:hypothetical protein